MPLAGTNGGAAPALRSGRDGRLRPPDRGLQAAGSGAEGSGRRGRAGAQARAWQWLLRPGMRPQHRRSLRAAGAGPSPPQPPPTRAPAAGRARARARARARHPTPPPRACPPPACPCFLPQRHGHPRRGHWLAAARPAANRRVRVGLEGKAGGSGEGETMACGSGGGRGGAGPEAHLGSGLHFPVRHGPERPYGDSIA